MLLTSATFLPLPDDLNGDEWVHAHDQGRRRGHLRRDAVGENIFPAVETTTRRPAAASAVPIASPTVAVYFV